MSFLITGSIAYDHIMVYPGEFKDHILPDKVHILNVVFPVDSLEIQYGGTATNIAYNLQLLEEESDIFATVGNDFQDYAQELRDQGHSLRYVHEFDDLKTAQAFITTDLADNQIAAFHGGAMFRAHEYPLSEYKEEPEYVMISPNGIQAMVDHAEHCRKMGWTFLFDPGQALSALDASQILSCLKGAHGVFVNDYEWEMLKDKSGFSQEYILEMLDFVVITLGSKGAQLFTSQEEYKSSAVPNMDVIDPTGAGDAFRAGFLSGLRAQMKYPELLKYSCAVASFSLEHVGPQSHSFTLTDLKERMALI